MRRHEYADQFEALLGPGAVLSDPASLTAYGIDATVGYRGRPALALFPRYPADAAAALALARREGLVVTARGGGTSLAAGATPLDGSLVLSTERLDSPPQVDASALSVSCGAGVKTGEIDAAAARHGLFLAPDPGARSISMIGGNVSTNAGGSLGLSYGVMRHHVLGVEYASLDGRVRSVRRGTAGEGILELLIGSEGTLGLITAVELALLPLPPDHCTVVALCEGTEEAAAATVAMLNAGLAPARIEFFDDVAAAAVQAARDRGLTDSVGAYLLIEFDGSTVRAKAQATVALQALESLSGISAREVSGPTEDRFWEARHAITSSLARIRPGKIGEDICLPRTRLPEAVSLIKELSARLDLPIALFGHIGDGTLHPNVLYDPLSNQQRERAREALGAIAQIAIDLGGVLSGEHGLGRVKRAHLSGAFDSSTLGVFQRLRRAADPAVTLNRPLQWIAEGAKS